MSKRGCGKSKKRNVLGELKDGCEVNTSRADGEEQGQTLSTDEDVEDINKTKSDKGLRSSFQSIRPCLEPVDEDEFSEDVDEPESYSDDPDDPDYNGESCSKKQKNKSNIPPEIKKKQQCVRWDQLKKIPYELKCEWRDCNYTSYSSDEFIKHVGDHIPQLEIREAEDRGLMYYVCSWNECEMEIATSDEAMRHVYYHGFHTKLKGVGNRIMSDESHPKCLLDSDSRNLLLNLPVSFTCFWEKCDFSVSNAQKFYYHVQAHAVCYMSSVAPKAIHTTTVNCQWRGCRSRCRGQQKLIVHLSTHTKEKVVACPVCGSTFASKTKFFDHCSRQQPKHTNRFQCSHCARSYSHERLLRDHMRHHINSYKCPFCDMTSPTPSSMSLHIRNKHITDRPFKCEYCNYRAKAQHNLIIHMSTHYSQALYHCEVHGCNYSCRTVATLNKHIRRAHTGEPDTFFCCHICDVRYLSGQNLSKHLMKKHNFRLPSGHSRFRYKADSNGFYRLETVRYESLEVTQEMIQEGQQPGAQSGTMMYLSDSAVASAVPASGPPPVKSAPLYIAYETLDTDGNLVSHLIGQPLAIPVAMSQPDPSPSLVLVQDQPIEEEPDPLAIEGEMLSY